VVFEQAQQNVGCDVVGEVADHDRRIRSIIQSRSKAAGLGAKDGVEFDFQDVAFNDLDIGAGGEFQAQLGREYAIKLDGDDFVIMREEEVLGIITGAAKKETAGSRK